MSRDLDQKSREADLSSAASHKLKMLQDDNDRLNRLLVDKERQLDKKIAEQKNEWAEIYGSQKQTADKLNQEITSLRKQLLDAKSKEAMGGGGVSHQEFAETTKRLKKRELECHALWDTLKDLKNVGKDTFDTKEIVAVLKKRSLETKAPRKLGIQI